MNRTIYLSLELEKEIRKFLGTTPERSLKFRKFRKQYYYNNEPSLSRLVQKALQQYLKDVKT